MSPQVLLVLVVALTTASIAGLLTRASIALLPIYWVVGVAGLLMGEVIGKARGLTFFSVGQALLGPGVACDAVLFAGVYLLGLWYNGRKR
jgi:hypothetical protein